MALGDVRIGERFRTGAFSKRRVLAGVVALVLVASGCQTTAWVRLDIAKDGSGSVAVDVYLDREAAAQVGDLSQILITSDLKKAGWSVIGPAAPAVVARRLGATAGTDASSRGVSDAALQVHLSKRFANVDEANRILASLSGPAGPFRGLELTRHSSLFRTVTGFSGTVDLRSGLDTFGDRDLTRVLGKSLGDTMQTSGGRVPKGDDLKVGLTIVPTEGTNWSGELGNDSMGDQVVGMSTNLGGGPERIAVESRRTRWGVVAGAGIIIGLVLIGLVATGIAFRGRADEAEAALLGGDHVRDVADST